ncbi:helix-turn-helix domain-containing protein [Nocardia cyriacigeorgica]|nr:helix-turn-helix domain-containing protein [Nocardia cyriacigeorgica]MBF6090490.1 helix-turn-helix domain-containing protein [Nocardia cyriacigeorgica]MBF6093693.1 helix-turn-helix domain-containing protein [Nocardia cyriacigeorgica]MBF6098104.1 helix-turn-helix domain-containing protein [Nocardia cyriacigeorgica]MBF6289901.1 helix-turn-helix domain-containing protein [Nocardia cyriacigeorgica]
MLCVRCRGNADQVPDLPDHAWWSGDLRRALDARDIGAVIRAFRYHPYHARTVSQQDMARWLSITQGYLSRIETGRVPVSNLNTLISHARTLRIPPALLWFDLPTPPDENVSPARSPRKPSLLPPRLAALVSAPTEDQLADTLLTNLGGYSARDQLAGPHGVIEVVRHDFAFINDRLTSARNRGPHRLLYTAGRYAEFLSWLYQDCGDLDTAGHWSRIALNHAQHAEDAQFRAYTLMRSSNIATDAGDPSKAKQFIDAALAHSAALTSRQQAALLRQRAHVSALRATHSKAREDMRECVDALARATEAAAEATTDPDDLAGYCSPEYVTMEAAHCWIGLGQPEQALAILQPRLAAWSTESRRDLGMGLARLCTAYAGVGSWEETLEAASYAATIVADTRSHRTLAQLHATENVLVAAGQPDIARELAHCVRAVQRAHP